MPQTALEKAARKFLKLNDERKAAERRANALEKELEPLAKLLLPALKKQRGKSRAMQWGRVRASIEIATGSIRWKQEFIRVTSEEKANEIKPPEVERLRVELV